MSGLKDGDYTIQMGEMKPYQIVGVQVGDPGPAEYIKIEAPEDIWRFKKLDNGHYTISVYRQDSPDLKISKVYNNYPVVSVSGSPAEWQLVPAGDAGFYAIVVPSSSSHTKGWTAPSADSKSNIVTLENIDTTQPPLSQKWYIAISY